MKITGSLSRMEVLSKPLAKYGLDGTTTFRPGVLAYQFSKFCECCELSIPALPVGPRNTMGTGYCPPDMDIILAALLMIWSMATSEKLKVMNSMTGRSPLMAAPMPMPVKPSSAIGVSITRFGPNSSSIPWLTLYAPLYSATSSPIRNTLGSRRISSERASRRASRKGISLMSVIGCLFLMVS